MHKTQGRGPTAGSHVTVTNTAAGDALRMHRADRHDKSRALRTPLSRRGTRDRAKGAIAEPLDGGALTHR
jgi:hypothetical protein